MAEYVINGSQPVNENTYKFPVKGVSQKNAKDTIGATVVEDSSYLNKATNSVSFQNDREKPIFPIYSTDIAGSLRVVGNQMDPPLNDAKTIRNTKDTTAIRNGDFNSFTAKFTSSPSTDSITLCPGRTGLTFKAGDATKTVDEAYEPCTQSGGARTDLPVVTRFGRWNETDGYTGSLQGDTFTDPYEPYLNPNVGRGSTRYYLGWIMDQWVEGRKGIPKQIGIDYGVREVGSPLTLYREYVFDPGLVLDGCSPDGTLTAVNPSGEMEVYSNGWDGEIQVGTGPWQPLSSFGPSLSRKILGPSDSRVTRTIRSTVVGRWGGYMELDFIPDPQPQPCDSNGIPSGKLDPIATNEYWAYLWPSTQPDGEYPNIEAEVDAGYYRFGDAEFYGEFPTYWGSSSSLLSSTDIVNLINTKANLSDPNTHQLKETLINVNYERTPKPDLTWFRAPTETRRGEGYIPEIHFNASNEYIWMMVPHSMAGNAYMDRNSSFRIDAASPAPTLVSDHARTEFNRNSLWTNAGNLTSAEPYRLYRTSVPVSVNSLLWGHIGSFSSYGLW